MADAPVLKRLEEIEHPSHAQSKHELAESVSYLLRLARAMLESQGELMEAMPANCRFGPECPYCRDMVARAERVRRGEV